MLGFNHLRTLIALPQSREWRLALSRVAALPAQPRSVTFIAPTINDGPITTHDGVRDEFGVPTSASTWADPSLVWLAARQARISRSDHLEVHVILASRGGAVAGRPAIDMSNLRVLR